jgi:putative NADPH-quinone reductase
VLHEGYARIQPLEPDLVAAQAAIIWAEHLVFVYPIWWGAMPALLKGFIDRVFLPGFAFKYREGSVFWDRLLVGRSAQLLVTMDSPPWYFRWVVRMPGHNQMKRAILGFSGIKPVRIMNFGPVKSASQQQREKWLAQASLLGKNT